MKLRQIFVLMKSQKRLKMGHGGSNAKSLSQILEKPCVRSKGHIFSPILLNLIRIFALMKSWTSLIKGHVGSKTRSLGLILEKPCIRSRDHFQSNTHETWSESLS